MRNLSTSIGFFGEVLAFMEVGYHIAIGNHLIALVFFVLAFGCAYLTGKLIEKDAIEKYERNFKLFSETK